MLQQNRNAGELQLNAADLACARQLLESHQESKDPSPMYDFLIAKGDRYATLANGVARGNSIAGGMAIHYLESVAASHNQPINEGQLNDIRFAMAHGYLDMQQDRLDKSGDTIYGDINHKQAALFHNRVFREFVLPPEAWTLDPVFKAIDEKSRPVYWEQVLNAAGKPVEELKLSVDTYQKMALSSKLAPDEIQKSSQEWFARVDSPSGYWALGKSATSQLFTPPTKLPSTLRSAILTSTLPQLRKRHSALPMKIKHSGMSLMAIWSISPLTVYLLLMTRWITLTLPRYRWGA